MKADGNKRPERLIKSSASAPIPASDCQVGQKTLQRSPETTSQTVLFTSKTQKRFGSKPQPGSSWVLMRRFYLLCNWQTSLQRNGPQWAYSQLIVPIVGKKREETHQQRKQKHHHVPAGPQTCCYRGLFLLLFTPWSIRPYCSSTNAVQILLETTGEIWHNTSFLQPLRHFIRLQNIWDEMFVVAANNRKH